MSGRPDSDESALAVSASLLIDDQLCFALHAASRAVTAAYRSLLEPLGLTYPQYLVMLVLWQRGPVSIKEVAAALHLDYGTLTPLLKRLEALGRLERRRRTDDERAVQLSLTAAGEALRERAAAVPVGVSHALGLTVAETRQLDRLLGRVRDNASAYAAEHAHPPS